MRSLLLSAALLSAAPAFAQAQAPTRFAYAGVEYEYVVKTFDDGSRQISGRNLSNGQPFKLTVRGQRVNGTVSGSSVAFSVPRAASGETRLASK